MGYTLGKIAFKYQILSIGDDSDKGPIDISADVLADELVPLNDQDQGQETGQNGSKPSEEEVLEICPESFFLHLFFHGDTIARSPYNPRPHFAGPYRIQAEEVRMGKETQNSPYTPLLLSLM